MPRRIALLTLLLLAVAGPAYGHGVEAECRVLPGKVVRVEVWYETGDSARDARVQVTRADGSVLAQGRTNSQGLFLFSYEEPEPLTVLIDAGEGHGKKLSLTAADLGTTASDAPSPPPAKRDTGLAGKDVLLGVTFLLALAAFVLAVRSAQELRRMRSSK